MVIFLDSNIVLDVLLQTPDLCDESKNVISVASAKGFEMYVSAASVTDIFYVLRKQLRSNEKAKELVRKILMFLSVAGVDEQCIFAALESDWADFEDSVQNQVAQQIRADYIVTRNTSDFLLSANRLITPTEFLKIYQK